jgi:hypothetical protein
MVEAETERAAREVADRLAAVVAGELSEPRGSPQAG